MIRIEIEKNEETGDATISVKDNRIITEDLLLRILLNTYLSTAQQIVKEHSDGCDDPDCCVVPLHTEVCDAIETTIELHNITHGHKHKEE
jgi:hypothetical protein